MFNVSLNRFMTLQMIDSFFKGEDECFDLIGYIDFVSDGAFDIYEIRNSMITELEALTEPENRITGATINGGKIVFENKCFYWWNHECESCLCKIEPDWWSES